MLTEKELADTKALKAMLNDATTDYAQHSPGCCGGLGYPCDCGYDEWLIQVKQTLGEKEKANDNPEQG